MDRSKARSRVLIAAALLLLAASDAPSALPLTDARWLAAGAPLDRLVREPGECVAWPTAPPLMESAQIGRVAFRAPLLLGGQAARAGLSCSSCHRNGRDNPHFHFPGISGAPGTADVTASLLSSHRGDGKFNPKPIPDLADPTKLKVSRDVQRDDLRKFIRGLIVEEFDGPEPPPLVLQGLLDYVRFMDVGECGKERSIRLADDVEDVETVVRLAQRKAAIGDVATARFLLGAARSRLGRIDERFSVAGLEAQRAILKDASVELGAAQQTLGGGGERTLLTRWQVSWASRRSALLAVEGRSLYSEAAMRRYAGAPAR